MLQKIDLIGNLVADAEIRSGKEGGEYIAFRVAVSEHSGEEKNTTYYEVTCSSLLHDIIRNFYCLKN